MTFPYMPSRIPPPPPHYDAVPIHNELLDKLNVALRKRAEEMTEHALAPVLQQAAAPITKAISTIIGGNNGAALAAVQLHVGDALNAIARDVKEDAYQALMRRAIHHLSTGQDFSLD